MSPGPLAASIVALAGTPDDAPTIDHDLLRIARLAADTVETVVCASITALRGDGYTTVAASSATALAVDEAQYADAAGPCLDAVDTDMAVVIPDIGATMSWPGFVRVAVELGLNASVSIPLHAGRGGPVAVLNLYGRDTGAMAPLIAGVESLYDPGLLAPDVTNPGIEPGALDPGSADLLNGLAEAVAARATIQVAISALMARSDGTADAAYRSLRACAAETGTSLTTAAVTVITRGC